MNPIIFYSSFCPHSAALIQDIKAKKLDLSLFEFFDVSRQGSIPSYVKRVPMMVLQGYVYVDDELTNFFNPVDAPRASIDEKMSTNTGDTKDTFLNHSGLNAFNDETLSLLCETAELEMSDSIKERRGEIDFSAAPELMDLPLCLPMPTKKSDERLQ
jgi:hypothetical protein